jgi:beta-glucosidase
MDRRILTEMFRFHLFNRPARGSTGAVVTGAAHAAVARRVAEEGTVLLKNGGGALPLDARRLRSIAVIGDDAGPDAIVTGGGSAAVKAPYLVTPYRGIAARAGSRVKVTYTPGTPTTADLPVIPATAFPGGLTVRYYNNPTLSGAPAAKRAASDIDADWNGAAPALGAATSGWSARWTGRIVAPRTGLYALGLDGGGNGTRLYLNGVRVVDGWAGSVGSGRAVVRLTAGRPVDIEVDYAENLPVGYSFLKESLSLGWTDVGALEHRAVAAARSAQVPIVFAGYQEGETADLTGIGLGAASDRLIAAVARANPRTIVVLDTGSAVTMPWLGAVRGVLEAWYPGQEDGRAIAAVLFGDVDPSGRLPVTFPQSLADVPARTPRQWPGVNGRVDYSEGLRVGYRWYDAEHLRPLFPFGYGLSYTTFRFRGLRVAKGDGGVTVRVEVTNTGRREGAETVQVYVGDPASAGEPPEQLKGYEKVGLRPGQTAPVVVRLPRSAFSYWNTARRSWAVAPGTYRIMVGGSSADLPLRAAVRIGR